MALTQDCNYRCKYCYAEFQRNDGFRMSHEVIENFLHDCSVIGVKAITFTGDGESSLSPNFEYAITRAHDLGIDVATSTHGEQLEHVDLYKVLKCLTYIRVNISAGTSDRYARIHGVSEKHFSRVTRNIQEMVRIKEKFNLKVTIGLQMVLMPENAEDIIPLAEYAVKNQVDYLVIKHCSDDINRTLKIDYDKYLELIPLLENAEKLSNLKTQITAKMSKLLSRGKREYTKCYGPSLMLQISGTGLVAPCGDLFERNKKKFHIGNICEQRFIDIWKGNKFKEVMDFIGSDKFNPQVECGTLCLQHYVNGFLFDLKKEGGTLNPSPHELPSHVNFI